MPYPGKPLSDYERAFEMGRDIEPPAMPTPEALKTPSVVGGAPKLDAGSSGGLATSFNTNVTPPPTPPEVQYTIPAFFPVPKAGPEPYWVRTPPPEAPTNHTLYPAVPWDRKEIEGQWGDFIKNLGDSIWKRYQALPPEQKALAAWQQVAKNPQEAAYTIVARSLANAARVKSGLTPEAASNIQNSDLFRWLHSVRR